ncbi:MAG: adenylate/guanylate cyclase domain-containing protein [Dehalococcoidia bacterium]|nr:adenylate/guanylate cyclase domain-containing protein [Dehalococcoidia bacterium]
MRCSSCSHENPEDASFCTKCGARLALVCADCSRVNPADNAFCSGCGRRLAAAREEAPAAPDPLSYTPKHLADKILRDRASLEGERRTVTVLFADAAGFTPLSERLDEEDVYDLMQGCLARMMDAVHHYEGTVVQFTGDGVMALFGAPIAHEDTARRAVAAGLEMQRALEEYARDVHERDRGIECRFRVGLNTGPVVVGKISDDLDMEYTALGDTVNLASRMQELAEPGTVHLTENTYRLARDYFECEPLGALSVKGKSAPVVAYKALREKSTVRTRFQAATERGLTPFVGRAQELNVLRGYFQQAQRGQGHVAFVSGEAGLGKSRLLLEFRRSILDEPIRWLEGHCSSYGKRIPYLPISDLIKRNFGVDEGDNDARIIRRVEEGIADWEDAAKATAPYLKYLLNVDPGDPAIVVMDPLVRRAGILDGLRALVLQESRNRLLTVVVEDLHWIDEKSEDALRALVDVVATAPVFMVLTYRPGYAHSLGERTYHSRMSLGHLQAEESATIAERVLQVSALPEPVRQLITSKGEGNPFYIEEVTKSLMESGVLRKSNGSLTVERPIGEISIPDTIQEVILSRIDRLEREARDAIQLASVIGREFTVRLLQRISDVDAKLDDLLGGLKVLELIYEKAYFPELSYMFKHALTHDVAYSTLLLERRKALHRLVAAAIEELYADRLPEHYEALAYHWYEAQDWEKALEYLDKAGDKAAAAYANEDALDYYSRATGVAEKLGGPAIARAAGVAQKRGHLNFDIGEVNVAIEDFEKMRLCAQAVGDRRLEGMALAWRGNMQFWAHDMEAAAESLQEALAIGDEGYGDVTAAAAFWLGTGLTTFGHAGRAEPYLHKADESVPEIGDPDTVSWWAFFGGMREQWRAEFGRALEHFEHWREASAHSLVTMVGHQWGQAITHCARGEYRQALALLHKVIATCERTGERLFLARALNTVGWVLCELQDHETAIEWDKRSEEAALAIGALDPEVESNARLNAGDSLVALGRLDEAEAYYKMVESVVRNPAPPEHFALWLYSQHFFHSYGELWLARGDHEKALGLADECVKLAESTNRPKNVVKGRRLRGQALTTQGKLDEAETEIDVALGIAKEIGNPPQLWKTYLALGDLRRAQKRPRLARKAYRAALAVIEGVAAGLTDESLRQTFLGSAHVQAVRRAAGR